MHCQSLGVAAGQDSEIRLLNIVQCCPETPVMGGKHTKPSKYCPMHSQADKNTDPVQTYIRSRAAQQPDREDENLLVAYKKSAK